MLIFISALGVIVAADSCFWEAGHTQIKDWDSKITYLILIIFSEIIAAWSIWNVWLKHTSCKVKNLDAQAHTEIINISLSQGEMATWIVPRVAMLTFRHIYLDGGSSIPSGGWYCIHNIMWKPVKISITKAQDCRQNKNTGLHSEWKEPNNDVRGFIQKRGGISSTHPNMNPSLPQHNNNNNKVLGPNKRYNVLPTL